MDNTYGGRNCFTLNLCYIAEPIGDELRAKDGGAALEWFALDDLPKVFLFQCHRQMMEDLKKRMRRAKIRKLE